MTEIKKQEDNKVFFDLTVTAEAIKKAEDNVYRKNRKYFNVPGFRKGKAPKKLIENMYGKGIFFEDAINDILPEMYDEAVKELELEVIDQPNVDIESYEPGEDVIVNIDVEVVPEVKLGKYKGVEIEAVSEEVPEDLIDNELENQRQMNARRINIDDRPAEDGDTVNIDFEGTVDGEAFEGGAGENQDLELGSNSFIPGFEEAIVGHEVGETFDIEVKFPEDYFSEELQDKDAVFTITLNSIFQEELPEIDDEFIKDISEFDTVEEYRDDVREKKTEEVKNSAEISRQQQAISKVAEDMEVEVPEVMVDNALEERLRNMDYNMRSQGLQLDDYLQMMGTTREQFKETMRDDALIEVKNSLALNAVVKAENFDVTDEELEKEAREVADKYFGDDEEKKDNLINNLLQGDKAPLINDLKQRKALDFIVENAIEVEPEEEDNSEEVEEDIEDIVEEEDEE